ncbi:hypothetical protein FRC0456_01062 [Corynebacterium diphtheriae]|nr:hypothetical protein BT092_04845 [Corynebacterium diphtheriae]CAB0503915.1 hypothetical protein FRC061569_00936 [Corynebacterium diphtheriae]CAB0507809.1 hypothetical protein FRC020322_01178 [Corynebacterium diphtheriae]CAB0508008.1 hypothetical protein FRC031641_01175 [Corynebacterium diphtheriae]CAB0508344.1 hypothetical protein FRC020338_01174 [Corynebacterium diphtheriae]
MKPHKKTNLLQKISLFFATLGTASAFISACYHNTSEHWYIFILTAVIMFMVFVDALTVQNSEFQTKGGLSK